MEILPKNGEDQGEHANPQVRLVQDIFSTEA